MKKIATYLFLTFLGIPVSVILLLISLLGYVRNPPGNGGNCFYFLGEIRQYSGSQSEISSFYEEKPVSVDFAINGKFSQQIPYGLDDLSQWPIKSTSFSNQNIYIVYWLVPDDQPPYGNPNVDDLDLRCS